MSADASGLIQPVAGQTVSSQPPHVACTDGCAQMSTDMRQPCVGQESNNTRAKPPPPAHPVPPPRRGPPPPANSTGGPPRSQRDDANIGARPPPQGAPSQPPPRQTATSGLPSPPASPPGTVVDRTAGEAIKPLGEAMKVVVMGGISAAAVGLGVGAASRDVQKSQGSEDGHSIGDAGQSNANVSVQGVANGHLQDRKVSKDDPECVVVELRKHPVRTPLFHAHSEADSSDLEMMRRSSQSMVEIKEHAYQRLQEELSKAQTDLRLKDEEVEKLSKVRDQMEQELDDLTASLFEEANKMVQEANVKRMRTEKLLAESNQKIEVLQAEVVALKHLVMTSTPSSPNKHLHPQIAESKEKKTGKPFWKTHRRSTSHHEFTKESRQVAEAQQAQAPVHCKDFDVSCYDQFVEWRREPIIDRSCPFLARMMLEDIVPCLNFSNKKLAERVQHCVEQNTLAIEPIPGDNSYPRKCRLTETNKLCNYKIRLEDDSEWYSISQFCRNRIATVCDFYTYIRYILQGLVRNEDKDIFLEIVRLRRQMALARLGLL